jgi:hypothetical protein
MRPVHTKLNAKPMMNRQEKAARMHEKLPTFRVMASAMAVAGLLLAMAAIPSEASAEVRWLPRAYWAPTVLQPGEAGGLIVDIGNAGDEPSSGWPTVQITLPPDVTLASFNTGTFWECTPGVDPQVVTCTSPLGNSFPFAWPPAYSLIGSGLGTGNLPIQLSFDVASNALPGTYQLSLELSDAGAVEPTIWTTDVVVGGPPAKFGAIDGTFQAGAKDLDGAPYTQAGGHPDLFETAFVTTKAFNEVTDPSAPAQWGAMVEPVSGTKDIIVDLPAGFIGDPQGVPECTISRVEAESDTDADVCPPATQVGIAEANNIAAATKQLRAIYNVTPHKNAPAQFAFYTEGGPVILTPRVRSDGDWGLSVDTKNITEANPLFAARITMWGKPASSVHDDQRCAKPNALAFRCVGFDSFGDTNNEPVDRYVPHDPGILERAFLSNPTRCDGTPEIVSMHLSPWVDPAAFEADGDPDLTDPLWANYTAQAPPLTGCGALSFIPSIDVKPTRSAPGSASGLEFKLNVPQNDDPDGLATAHLRNATVTLPAGTTVNSGSAENLDSCSPAEIGLVSKAPVRFTKLEPSCPLQSKIGTVEVDTPLLDEPLQGDVFLAAQGDNPFDTLVAMYVVVRGPGILGKLAAKVDMDGQTGQITTTVVDNPQLPFDSLTVKLKPGDRAPLTLPSTCGSHTTTGNFVSWAGHNVTVTDDFAVDCPGNSGVFNPTFEAGTSSPTAGGSSPLNMRITRTVGKELGRIETTLPKGLLASPKDVAVCSESVLAPLAAHQPGHPLNPSGRTTQATPSCPAASQIGTTTVGVGSGPDPFFPLIPGTQATGRVFLTGPHSGTDLPQAGKRQIAYGAAIEVPAVAGPFDLGTVLVRAAIYADPTSAELTVVSDKLPRILRGVPLDVRDIRVSVDRAGFTRNPTSCSEKQIAAEIQAQDGTTVQRSSRFQVGDCAALGFKPRLGLRLTGGRQMKSLGHPGVRAVVRQGRHQAGIEQVQVRLPRDLALDPDNAQALCEFEDGTKDEPTCPAGSVIGRASAVSPLLKAPLRGKVYFVKNVRIDKKTGARIRTLPMLVVALRGEIAVNLRGQSNSKGGRLINTFAQVPDAPISKFGMRLKGGSNGILVVTESAKGRISLCSKKQIAEVDADGQNGKRRDFNVRVKTACKKRAKSKR